LDKRAQVQEEQAILEAERIAAEDAAMAAAAREGSLSNLAGPGIAAGAVAIAAIASSSIGGTPGPVSNIIDSPRLNDATPATTKVMTTTPKEKAAERAVLRAAEVKKIQDGRVQAQEMKQAAVAEKKAATAAARGVARASSEPLYKALRKSSAPISYSSYDGIMSKMDISCKGGNRTDQGKEKHQG